MMPSLELKHKSGVKEFFFYDNRNNEKRPQQNRTRNLNQGEEDGFLISTVVRMAAQEAMAEEAFTHLAVRYVKALHAFLIAIQNASR